MKTSQTEIKHIDKLLSGTMPNGDRLISEARMIVDAEFGVNVGVQRKLYVLVRMYGRMKMKKDLERMHLALLDNPTDSRFRKMINAIFSKE